MYLRVLLTALQLLRNIVYTTILPVRAAAVLMPVAPTETDKLNLITLDNWLVSWETFKDYR
jgi:hypothetical protein